MSQFAFLKPEFPEIHQHAARAETLARSDPRAACFYARFALETAVDWLYRHDADLRDPYDRTLSARIHEPSFRRLVGEKLVAKARIVKDYGNAAVHDPKPVSANIAATALRELFHLSYWLVRTYARGDKPAPERTFVADSLPFTADVPALSLKKLQAAAAQLADAVKAKEEAEARRLAGEDERRKLEAELTALRAEMAAVKAVNVAAPDAHDFGEAETRVALIDVLLKEAGWTLDQPRDREFPVSGLPDGSGRGFVDYVLWGDDGKPLAAVEAKRTGRDARAGREQAKRYADCLETMFGRRPVIFYTNGYEHWIWDDGRYPPRAVAGFFTKAELERIIRRRAARKPLAAGKIDADIVERFYQTRAIRRVAESFEKDNLRRALLVMATGAGKTRTVIALADLLMRANWAHRVLFLADRRALVKQAVNAFKKHLPSSAPVNLLEDGTGKSEGRVYVATYPTMMKLVDGGRGAAGRGAAGSGKLRFGPGAFDLIVVDEAHRSIYRKYGALFDYFDALLVGLTATPKNEVDRDTYRLFGLEREVPTDAYGLDEAVRDGFLVPPLAVSAPLRFQRDGIKYDDLPDAEKERWDAVEWDEDGEVPDAVEAAAVNAWLFNADTVDKALECLMTEGIKAAGGDRLGKTIIFARNHHHAEFIVSRFDLHYPQYKGLFARVIDHQTECAESLLDDFSLADKAPHIAVSVDMLDTGVDVPEVVNLVFFKIVRSKTKFWQMIGRGTRTCADLFGPNRHKENFRIFDFCQNFEFFNQNPKIAEGTVEPPLSARLFAARVALVGWMDSAPGPLDDGMAALRGTLTDRLRREVRGMNLDNFLVRPKRRLVEKYAEAAAWDRLDQAAQVELTEELADSPTMVVDDDIDAKRFDLTVLKTQLALLQGDGAFAGLRKKLMETAALLEEIANIPMVAQRLELIRALRTDEFWRDLGLPGLEEARLGLRDLIKLIDKRRRPVVYTDFEDRLEELRPVALPGMSAGTDMERFRMKARHFLKANENHIAVARLRRNEPLTATDLAELERIFIDAGVGEPAVLDRLRAEGGLGLFVRSLVGLDREAAKAALGAFSNGRAGDRTLTANQMEFVDMIVDHLTERGVVEPELLYESPFTDLDPLGVAGVFPDGEVIEIVKMLNAVRGRAAA